MKPRIPVVALPQDPERLRRLIARSLDDFQALCKLPDPGKELIWATIAPIFAVINAALCSEMLEVWGNEFFPEKIGSKESTAPRSFFQTFVALHKVRKRRNTKLTVMMVLFQPGKDVCTEVSTKLHIFCAILEALPDDDFPHAAKEFLDELEEFLGHDTPDIHEKLKCASQKVGELCEAREFATVEEIHPIVERPVAAARIHATSRDHGSWVEAIAPFARALGQTDTGRIFLFADLRDERGMFWGLKTEPNINFFDKMRNADKLQFLKKLASADKEGRRDALRFATRFVPLFRPEERETDEFKTAILQLYTTICNSGLLFQGKFQAILENALGADSNLSVNLFLERFDETLNRPVPSQDTANAEYLALAKVLERAFKDLTLVAAHPLTPIASLYLANELCINAFYKVGRSISHLLRLGHVHSAMDLALAKISYRCLSEENPRQGEMGVTVGHLIDSARLKDSIEDAQALLCPAFLPKLKEAILASGEHSKILDLQLLASCGAIAEEILEVRSGIDD